MPQQKLTGALASGGGSSLLFALFTCASPLLSAHTSVVDAYIYMWILLRSVLRYVAIYALWVAKGYTISVAINLRVFPSYSLHSSRADRINLLTGVFPNHSYSIQAGRIDLLVQPSQSTASKHSSPPSVRVRVCVRVGGSALGASAKPPERITCHCVAMARTIRWVSVAL